MATQSYNITVDTTQAQRSVAQLRASLQSLQSAVSINPQINTTQATRAISQLSASMTAMQRSMSTTTNISVNTTQAQRSIAQLSASLAATQRQMANTIRISPTTGGGTPSSSGGSPITAPRIDTSGLEKSMSGVSSAMSGLKAVLTTLVTVETVSQFNKINDSMINLENRFKLVAREGQTGADVMNIIAASAISMGAPLKDVGDLFARVALATNEMGLSQSTQLKVTENLMKSFMATGTSAEAASGAVTQFTQALATGTLRGDELNSVLEGAPMVAQAIADKLHVSTGALKALGEQGKISAGKVIEAVAGMSDSMTGFNERTSTVGNAFNNLGTVVSMSAAAFDKSTGTSKAFQYVINEIAIAIFNAKDAWAEWGKWVVYAGEALMLIYAPLKIVRAAFALFGAIGTSVAVAFEAVGAAAAEAGVAVTGFAKYFKTFIEWLVPGASAMGAVKSVMGGLGATFASLLGIFGFTNHEVEKLSDNLTDQEKSAGLLKDQQKELNKIFGDQAKVSDVAAKASDKKTATDITNAAATKKALDELKKSYDDYNRGIQEQTATIGMGAQEKDAYQGKLAAEKSYNDAVKKIRDDTKSKSEYATGDEKAKLAAAESEQVGKLTAAYNEQTAKVDELTAAKEKAIEADNFKNYSSKTSIDLENQINNIRGDTAKVFMSDIEKKYYDIDAAAKASAKSAIEAEEARRGEKLSTEEITAYYDAATKGTTAVKEEQLKLNEATAQYQLMQFAKQTQFDMDTKTADIYHEMATSTLPELAKQQSDIAYSAEKSARAAIDAEEARRGEKLSADEVKKYYDAATAGSEKLAQATAQQYDQSRSFSTGWKKAMNDYVSNATNSASQAEAIFKKATGGMEDALVKFAKTGKFEWKSFVSDMLEQLLRSQIQQIFAQMMGGMQDSLGGVTNAMQGMQQGGMQQGYGMQQQQQSSGGGILGMIGNIFGGSSSKPQQQQQSSGGGFLSGLGDIFGLGSKNNAIVQGNGQSSNYNSMMGNLGFGSSQPAPAKKEKGFFESVGDFFGGLFANGGDLPSGKWGIAGEAGPELISGPARITPIRNGGMGSNVTYNINAVDAMSFKQMIAQDPSFLHAIVQQGARSVPMGGR